MKNLIYFLILLSLGCSSDHELGNGYFLVETNSFNRSIVKGVAPIVHSNIENYSSTGNYVIGLRQPSLHPDMMASEKYGFFILDLESGELHEGLSEREYIEFFKKKGITLP